MTFNKMNAHTNPIFIQLEFLKIKDIQQLQLLSFLYDCLNKTAPVFFMTVLHPVQNAIILIPDYMYMCM